MKEIIAKHEADKNIEALNAIKAETGLDSATVNLAEQAIARINEINKKATEVLETTPSEISQIKNLGGDIGNKTEGVDAKINELQKETTQKIEEIKNKVEYCDDPEINEMVTKIVSIVEGISGDEPDFGDINVEKMQKMATLAMKADASNNEKRFRPGNRLKTYTGVRNPDGSLKDETYGGEATIKEVTTIYRNIEPVLYADDERKGQPIRGEYEEDGTFVEKPEGTEILFNEYATDNPEHSKKKYGITAEPKKWIEGMAQIPSYLAQIPTEKGEIQIKTASGKMISVRGGDFIVVDNLGGGKTSVQGIENNIKGKTYRPWGKQEQKNENNFATFTEKKLTNNVDLFINENQDYTPAQKEQFEKKFKEALSLALEIHKDQKPRPDGPYVNHILRVSNRIVEEYGIKDPELVIAAALHDSVEDQAKKLANLVNNTEAISEREKALLFIKNTFGERVEKIVSKLSNPEPESEGLSPEKKNLIYKEHVKEAIEDSDVFPIKLSDFSDNALNLEAVGDPTRRLKLSKKYLPVIEVFVDRIERAQDILSPEKITEMKNRLLSAIEDIKNFIKNQENI
ncbi:MAG: HD domain-containing protein [bacterium]